jgi:lipopolysaccharide transport system ATP-binding protein
MSSDRPVAVLRGVGKRFPVHHQPPARSVKEAALGGFRELRRRRWQWALRDVDLDVAAGTSLGLIGHNGAGKSSLLRLMGGVGRPTTGTIDVGGTVGALLELGTGFHPELSGRESALLALLIAGCTRREAQALLPAVAEFAELEAHLDQPLRTYSSGMAARLAFAVATSAEPDLLLVDEVLAVGDLAFQQRCLARIEAHRRRGATVVLVSHDPALVADTCEEVAWLDHGRLVARGPTEAVLEAYVAANEAAARAATPDDLAPALSTRGIPLVPGVNRVGSQQAHITAVHLLDGWGRPATEVPCGGPLTVAVALTVPEDVGMAHLGVRIVRSRDRTTCVDASTPVHVGDGEVRVDLERLDLAPGHYDVVVGLFDRSWASTFDHHEQAYPLAVVGDGPHTALLAPPLRWSRSGAATAPLTPEGTAPPPTRPPAAAPPAPERGAPAPAPAPSRPGGGAARGR